MAQLIVQIVEPFLHLLIYWILLSLLILANYLFCGFLKEKKPCVSILARLFDKYDYSVDYGTIPSSRSHFLMPFDLAIVYTNM